MIVFSEYTGSSMLLDLHIEGSAPVTLLVRDESRSTRSTSGYLEDDKSVAGNSNENLSNIKDSSKPRVEDTKGNSMIMGDNSFDNLSINQEKKRRAEIQAHPRKQKKKKIKRDEESTDFLEASMSVSSSKSSLFLDSEGSEKADAQEKGNICSKYESRSPSASDEYNLQSNGKID